MTLPTAPVVQAGPDIDFDAPEPSVCEAETEWLSNVPICGPGPACQRWCRSFYVSPDASALAHVKPFAPANQHESVSVARIATRPVTDWRRFGKVGAVVQALFTELNVETTLRLSLWFERQLRALTRKIYSMIFGEYEGESRTLAGGQIAWHPQGDYVASAVHGAVSVHRFGNAEATSRTSFLQWNVQVKCLVWVPNHTSTIVVGGDQGFALWTCEDGLARDSGWICQFQTEAVGPIDILECCPSGRFLATVADNRVYIWNIAVLACSQGQPLSRKDGFPLVLSRWSGGGIRSLAWDPVGTGLLAVGHDRGVRIWDSVQGWKQAFWRTQGPSLAVHWNRLAGSSSLVCTDGQNLFHMEVGTKLSCYDIEPRAVTLRWSESRAEGYEQKSVGPLRFMELDAATGQRLALVHEGCDAIFIYEWLQGGRRQVAAHLRGILKGPPGAQCSALSFSQHAPGTGPATVLAVHWQWKGKGSEVWTYPVFFLSQRLLEKNPAVIYSEQNWF